MPVHNVEPIIAARRLLDHPFYVRWSRGELSFEELQSYAAQYRHFEALLPTVLDHAAATAPTASLRDAALRNLADETAADRPHIELFDNFVRSLRADTADPSPAMAKLMATYEGHVSASAVEALACVLAYEWQSAEVAHSKAGGLRQHYGLDGAAVEFWDVHAAVDGDHARWLHDALTESEADADVVAGAVRETCDAWLAFLDERQCVGPAGV